MKEKRSKTTERSLDINLKWHTFGLKYRHAFGVK